MATSGVPFCNASGFHYKRTDNCFTMKELHHIFPLKFLNVSIKLLFDNIPGNQNLSKVHSKKDTRTVSVNAIKVSL